MYLYWDDSNTCAKFGCGVNQTNYKEINGLRFGTIFDKVCRCWNLLSLHFIIWQLSCFDGFLQYMYTNEIS